MSNEKTSMNYAELFDSLHPHFFEQAHILALPPESVFSEQILDLAGFDPDAFRIPVPDAVTFGTAGGADADLRDAVRQVEGNWVQYFTPDQTAFCAFAGRKVVSFCILDDMGRHSGLRIGGPGCVGTVPEYRRRGIGLETVRLATALLRREGFDRSWIHYTQVDRWYEKLGYETVLRWNRGGILWEKDPRDP